MPAGTQAPLEGATEDREQREVEQVLDASAASVRKDRKPELSPDEQADALEWFLADSDDTDLTHSFQINVGSLKDKRWVEWTVKPVDLDHLRRIRRASQDGNRRARRAGTADFDEVAANVQIVVEGTVSPDLRAAAKKIGTADPGVAVRSRFAHKPGLLAQIAGEIMSISGYDDEDVREVDAARG